MNVADVIREYCESAQATTKADDGDFERGRWDALEEVIRLCRTMSAFMQSQEEKNGPRT